MDIVKVINNYIEDPESSLGNSASFCRLNKVSKSMIESSTVFLV